MQSRHSVRSAKRRTRNLLESLESRVLLNAISAYNFGTLASFNADQTNGNGSQPDGLVIDADGDLFGTTTNGGPQGYGYIFEVVAGTNVIKNLAPFTSATGFFATGKLVLDSSGNIFGAAADGGALNKGTIFELKAGDTAITTLASFNGSNGAFPFGGLTENDGILYGITFGNGSGDKSAVFTLDPTAPVIQDIAVFSTNIRPAGTLVVNADGDIFGATTTGGANNRGTIFEIVHGTNTVETLLSFNGTNGQTPLGTLILQDQGDSDITNDVIIGATSSGGTNNDGTLFAFNPTDSTITTLVSFNSNNGTHPIGNLITDAGGNILGTTGVDGPGGFGTLFRFNPNTLSLTTLQSFANDTTGKAPSSNIVMDSNGNIFGGTFAGGAFHDGTLFELSPLSAPQVPLSLSVVQQPVNSLAGQTFSVTVAVRDLFGNVETGDTSNVTLTLNSTNPDETFTDTEAAVNGVATFDVSLDLVGNYTFTATDGTLDKTVSKSFAISADAANNPHLVFAPDPAYLTVDKTALTPVTVLVEDNFGNVITTDHSKVTIAAVGGLSGTLTASVIAGMASFDSLKFNATGNYTLNATDTKAVSTDPDVTAGSGDVTVGTISKAVFSTQPAAVLAGHDFTDFIAVALQDGNGATVTSDSGTTVTLSILSGPKGAEFFTGNATHSVTLTATDESGTATFDLAQFDTAGTYVLEATVNGLATIFSKTFTVSPDTDTKQLVFTAQPTDNGVSTAIKPAVVVKIEDQFGNIFTKDNSRVTLSANGPGAASGTFAANASSGVATFSNLQFATADSYTVTASDGVITTADSDSFTIGAATHLVFTVQPIATVAGHTLATIKVSVEDLSNHVVLGDTSNVTLGLSFFLPGSGATLGGTTTQAAVTGVATFSDIVLDTAGNFTLVATDGLLSPGISNFFTVSPDVATHLAIFQQPSDVGANSKMTNPVIVYVEDQFGNIVTNNSSKVTLAPTPGSAVSNASVNANKGIATFTNFTVATAGNYTLAASDGVLATDVSDSFNVTAAAKLVFGQQPSTVVAGVAIAPAITVKVENSAGVIQTSDTSAVTITFTSPNDPSLTGTLTVNAVAGVATFSNVILDKTGNYQLTATDANLKMAVSNGFTVNPGAVTHLVFSQQPFTTVAGVHINPNVIVKLEDQFNNVVTNSGAPVTITAVTLSSLTAMGTVNASSGVATFSNLILKTSGVYSLTATALTFTTTSNNFLVLPAAATTLSFSQQPSSTGVGVYSAVVTLHDAFGNIASNNVADVTIQLGTHPATGTVVGVFTAPVVNGVATFDDIELPISGNYTLKAISSGLPAAISDPFINVVVI